MAKGCIYIMTNKALKNIVKIGFATDVEKRRKQLSKTALPEPYEVYATYQTSGNLEDKKLHDLIDRLGKCRVNKNREFFKMNKEKAYALLEDIATISGTLNRLKLNKNHSSQILDTKKQKAKASRESKSVKEDITSIPNGIYYLERDVQGFGKVKGRMQVKNNKFIVLKGACCAPYKRTWIPRAIKQAIIENNILQNDVVCNSPSLAGTVVMGHTINGWSCWKTKDGKMIDVFRK